MVGCSVVECVCVVVFVFCVFVLVGLCVCLWLFVFVFVWFFGCVFVVLLGWVCFVGVCGLGVEQVWNRPLTPHFQYSFMQ